MPPERSNEVNASSSEQGARRHRPARAAPTGAAIPPQLVGTRSVLDGGVLRPPLVRRLQRAIGNRALGRLLCASTAAPAPIAQRAEGDPVAGVAEAQYAKVGAGESISYTALAAGCMAITAHFADGGGVGYHFAMMEDNAAQWAEFTGQIGGAGLSQVRVDSDMVGEKEGWWVKFAYDVDEGEYGDPDTSVGPRSYASLTAELGGDAEIFTAGWLFDQEHIATWFEAALGVAADFTVTQSPGPYTL